MMPNEIVLFIFASIPIILCIVALIVFIVNFIKSKKFENQYKEIFDLIYNGTDYSSIYCNYCNTNISPLENQINSILNEQKYMVKEDFEKSNRQLELLRKKRKKYSKVAEELYDKLQKARENIKNKIIATNNKKFIKYMKELGWFREE